MTTDRRPMKLVIKNDSVVVHSRTESTSKMFEEIIVDEIHRSELADLVERYILNDWPYIICVE